MHVSRSHLSPLPVPAGKCLVVIAGALLTTAPHPVNGAAVNARSPALADVQTAIALAKDGDTGNSPGGHRQLDESASYYKRHHPTRADNNHRRGHQDADR